MRQTSAVIHSFWLVLVLGFALSCIAVTSRAPLMGGTPLDAYIAMPDNRWVSKMVVL